VFWGSIHKGRQQLTLWILKNSNLSIEFTSIWLSNLELAEHRNQLYISNINLKPSFLPLERANLCGHTTSPIATPLPDGPRFENSLYF
jgi:hypothetical protein